jgi:four helix bundle protein
MGNESTDAELIEWEKRQHEAVTGDPVWRLLCYREAMFLLEQVREDARPFAQSSAHAPLTGQLLRATGSISANIAEGYGRPTTADRIRYLSYALGSARESISWYEALRPSIKHATTDSRLIRLARIRRLLIGLLSRLRTKTGKKFDSW